MRIDSGHVRRLMQSYTLECLIQFQNRVGFRAVLGLRYLVMSTHWMQLGPQGR